MLSASLNKAFLSLVTFYLRLCGVRHMVKDHTDTERGKKEIFYLTIHSSHFIYGYAVSDIGEGPHI